MTEEVHEVDFHFMTYEKKVPRKILAILNFHMCKGCLRWLAWLI